MFRRSSLMLLPRVMNHWLNEVERELPFRWSPLAAMARPMQLSSPVSSRRAPAIRPVSDRTSDWLDHWPNWPSSMEPWFRGEMGRVGPRMDVSETDEAYHVELEVPGWSPEQIKIEMVGDRNLSIQGRMESYTKSSSEPRDDDPANKPESNVETAEKTNPDQKSDGTSRQYWMTERNQVSAFNRALEFDESVLAKQVRVDYTNGVLSIYCPKANPKAEVKPPVHRIEIQAAKL